MNLLLFHKHELSSDGCIKLDDHRAEHLIEVLKVVPGQTLKAGEVNGDIGAARVQEIVSGTVFLRWQATSAPPAKLECILILALPRPKMMSRILQSATAMGVKEIHLINSWKVDKSYWQSQRLNLSLLEDELLLGLSQSGDTQMPSVRLHRLFKPFAEDLLPELCKGREALVAHPYQADKCPVAIKTPSALAVGPEGGFTESEISLLNKAGMRRVNIGPRILRVETAVPAILSRLYPA